MSSHRKLAAVRWNWWNTFLANESSRSIKSCIGWETSSTIRRRSFLLILPNGLMKSRRGLLKEWNDSVKTISQSQSMFAQKTTRKCMQERDCHSNTKGSLKLKLQSTKVIQIRKKSLTSKSLRSMVRICRGSSKHFQTEVSSVCMVSPIEFLSKLSATQIMSMPICTSPFWGTEIVIGLRKKSKSCLTGSKRIQILSTTWSH